MQEIDLNQKVGAILSENGVYRYALWRVWDSKKPVVTFVMLNPSTADAYKDDPTIRRCIDFAKRWDCGAIIVVNLFAYRATDPKELNGKDPDFLAGDFNRYYQDKASMLSHKVIFAYGVQKGRPSAFLPHFFGHDIYSIGDLSKDQYPKHPLYLKSDLLPVLYLKA